MRREQRGAKHLDELANQVTAGHRAVMLYVIQRMDCDRFGLAADIDPDYATAFTRARNAGVEMLAYQCDIDLTGTILGKVDMPDGVTIGPVAAADTLYFLSNDADLVAYR